jgi:uncharacterized protein YbjT (DUF2867 family)
LAASVKSLARGVKTGMARTGQSACITRKRSKASPMQNAPILIIGANGKTGSRISRLLQQQGRAVRHGTRSAPIPFDWDDASTWARALDGASTAYVSYFPDLAFPGADDKIGALSELARSLGARRLVLLSGRGETHAARCEEIVRASGAPFTLLRCAWFAQNFSEGYLRDPVLGGVVALPAGDVHEPIIDVDDIAEVAASALTEDRHDGRLYELTGPELLHFSDAAAQLSAAAGRPVRYAPITLEAFHAEMTGIGGAFIADVFTHICREALDGRNQWLGDGVQQALGRAPRDFAGFCRRAAAAGAWRQAA